MAADGAAFNSFKVRENKGYHETMMEALDLKHVEAAKDGCGEYYEDVLDSIWSSIPTAEKLTIRVYTPDGQGELTAFAAWNAASALVANQDLPPEERRLDPVNRKRVNRKAQIITDTLYRLDFLYKKPPVGREQSNDGSEKVQWSEDVE